ncbi:MAG: hypothetical protein LQ343_002978 [Gyalolechia ehrenbergii]|nr:MAG: hypothetical protein LQ343_002978 [Gyalolechia ehrenbergii]
MHFFKLVALTGFFASAAFAAPSAEPNDQPPKPAPPPPTNPNQSNACGNGAAPFCCTTDKQGKYTSCYSFRKGSFIICTHANVKSLTVPFPEQSSAPNAPRPPSAAMPATEDVPRKERNTKKG